MIKIVSLKHKIGSLVVSNDAVEEKYNLPKGFILEKTGVTERVKFSQEEDPITIASSLLQEICKENNIGSSPVFGSSNPFGTTAIPSVTHRIVFGAGMRSIPVYHINYGCGGYLGAIDCLVNYLKTHEHSDALLVLADHPSTMVNNYQTEVLFSDAVHVSLWSNREDREGIEVNSVFFSTLLENPFALNVELGFWGMEGKKIVEFVKKVPGLVAQKMDINLNDFFIIPHQPNAKLLETLENEYGVPFYKKDAELFGNTTCSAMMIALENVLKEGSVQDKILLIGFGDTESYGGITLGTKSELTKLVK